MESAGNNLVLKVDCWGRINSVGDRRRCRIVIGNNGRVGNLTVIVMGLKKEKVSIFF